ncbi:tRNA modification GTPase MnmE [Smittium culicis]|uniref:tRNA modification GTPase MnmE n=1 Tax=Smittium culicis TaxID=133412 RepID=A0A1R1XCW7_9FUNG|nr:tRNA modification GTPase MnmE [Smittium culicis]
MTKSLNGKQSRIKPRTTYLRKIYEYGNENNLIDVGIVTFFNAPYSYTGEDMVELHVHGGNSIVKAVLNSIGKIPNCVLAKPGEFSERAFYNNKLDLTEIEGLADLINAETEYQRKQALSQAQGSNKQVFMGWRSSIIDAMANIETMIDFSEEESIDADLFANAKSIVIQNEKTISFHLKDDRRAEIIRNARRKVSIVSPTAGTTRDSVEVSLDLDGYQIVISDTAGLRKTSDDIETQGIEVAMQNHLFLAKPTVSLISCKTEYGIPQLLENLSSLVKKRVASHTNEPIFISRERHRQLLTSANQHLKTFIGMDESMVVEAAEELRLAADSIGKITGYIDTQQVLTQIFSQFCIGK